MPERSTETGTSRLGVDHLLGGAVLELEADVVEENQRCQCEEDGERGLHVTGGEAGDAVLDRIDDERDREEPEHEHARDRAGVRDPLALLDRGDRHTDREPDEEELEDVVTGRAEVVDLQSTAGRRPTRPRSR